MIQTGRITKSQQIVDALNQAIDSGELGSGARIESVRDIGRRFDASLSVVSNALNHLEHQGRIIRRPRSGIFVRPRDPAEDALASSVLVCMQPEGHVWGDFFGQVLKELNRRGLSAISFRHDMTLRTTPPPELARQLERLVHTDIKGAIVMGGDYWKNPFLEDFAPNKTVFVFELDYPLTGGHAVLVDYEAASHAIASHLIATGKRRIAFAVPPEAAKPGQRRLVHFDQLCNGYERALREHDLAGTSRYLVEFDGMHPASVKAHLSTMMEEPRHPDAIMCYMDSLAVHLAEGADALGVSIPGDLAVTGFYHTPWANYGARTLTTVKFDTREIARRAVELIMLAPEESQVTYVKPLLRIGESSQINTEQPK